MVNCPNCGGSKIESDAANGHAVCEDCGCVVEENTIVSEITFGESSTGAAIVQGSFLSGDATGARISGPFRNQSSENSREQTLRKGKQRVETLASAMRLPQRLAEQGVRFFHLAVNRNFIKGRRSQYVVASCLYIVCRNENTSHMLIDFSDLLGINVFVLGQTFLQLVKALHLTMRPIDPSLYIQRFAALLDFGEDTNKVAHDATRLVARMKRDWIDTGRRPSGICGACLIIAARMNNYRRSMAEIVHVVKVAESTLQQRLLDFSQTATANLTIEDYHNVWLEREANPPSFERDKRKKEAQRQKASKKQKRSRVKGENASEQSDEDADEEPLENDEEAAVRTLASMKDLEDDDGVFKKPFPVSKQGKKNAAHVPIDPALQDADVVAEREAADRAAEQLIESEVAGVLDSEDLQNLESEETARRAEAAHAAANDFDASLEDVDDDEIDNMILDDRAVEIKTQVWMQNNLDYLAAQEQKRLKADTDRRHGIKTATKKKRRMKPRDSSAPNLPQSPAESARQMMEERSFSKKINYDNFKDLFD